MNVILLGAPGAGKGTQAAKIKERYGISHISTGDAFRKNIAEGTEVGKLAKSYMDAGKLVPDDVVVRVVESRLQADDCKNGYMLDGFPRTIAQAEALEKIARIDAVIEVFVDDAEVMRRLTGRLSCKCGMSYHVSNYSEKVCAVCGKELFVRDDDKEETIAARLETYRRQTEPLVAFYRERGILHRVDGTQSADAVFAEIGKVLDDYR